MATARLAPRFRRPRSGLDADARRSALARGRSVISLVNGHLPGDVPRELRTLAEDAWREGHVSYVEGQGLEALRDAVVDWLDLRESRSPEEVLIGPGSRAVSAAVLAAIAGPGDVVLVDGAAWMVFQPLVEVVGAVPVAVHPADSSRHLKLTGADVRGALSLYPQARALLVANPVNPTAQLYTADELQDLLDTCAFGETWLVVDRLYGMLVYDGNRFPYLPPSPAFRDWGVLVDGVARAFRGMGGIRVGWACGPRDLVDVAAAALTAGAGPADRVAQKVALGALRGPYDLGLIEELEQNRDLVIDLAGEVPGMSVWPIAGSMFCVLDLTAWLGRATPAGWVMESSRDLADFLLGEAHVALTPGDIHLHPGLVRVAFAQPAERLTEAMTRIREALALLS